MKRDPMDFFQDIQEAILAVEVFVKGLDETSFQTDLKTQFVVIRAFEIIGEAANKIPTPIQAKFPDIPWALMIGMRNKLIHDYFGVDHQVLWKTLQDDLPFLKHQVSSALDQLKSDDNA